MISSHQPLVGLSLMLEDAYLGAAYPLFEAGEVEVLEWSFDVGWGAAPPAWAEELIDFYSESGRLLGHGVTFSALSAAWTPRQNWWLEQFERECARRDYLHISEHFGFLSAGSFHEGAPLPVPRTPAALAIGRDRLARLAAIADAPVGLENLAFAFGLPDVREQGVFLEELLEPVEGFLLLDLHNVYCQMCNFGLAASQILDTYPLHRVRELHVSGGSWSESSISDAPIRRDTHDEAVPDAVFDLVAPTLARCPNVRAVIFERLGDTLGGNSAEQFRADFLRLKQLVATFYAAL